MWLQPLTHDFYFRVLFEIAQIWICLDLSLRTHTQLDKLILLMNKAGMANTDRTNDAWPSMTPVVHVDQINSSVWIKTALSQCLFTSLFGSHVNVGARWFFLPHFTMVTVILGLMTGIFIPKSYVACHIMPHSVTILSISYYDRSQVQALPATILNLYVSVTALDAPLYVGELGSSRGLVRCNIIFISVFRAHLTIPKTMANFIFFNFSQFYGWLSMFKSDISYFWHSAELANLLSHLVA